MKKPLVIYMGGKPGSGKGTAVGNFVANSGYRVLVVETGQMIRDLLRSTLKTEIDKTLAERIKRTPQGKLVADDIIFELITRLFEREKKTITNYSVIIFDGVPRTEMQARWLDRFLQRFELKVNLVFELTLPREDALKRVETRAQEAGDKARDDDKNSETRNFRQDDYEREVGNTYRRYNGQCYIPIDSRPSKDEVALQIDNIITAFMTFADSFS